MKKFILTATALLLAASARAETFYVVDGDSLKLGETNVRLAHIDAPEYYQTCKRADKSTYNCGIKAREKLESLTKLGNVTCKAIGTDVYNRDMSECFAGGVNLNLEMVKSGWAVVYKSSKEEYTKAQADAKRAQLGIWQGKFMKPELYRILYK